MKKILAILSLITVSASAEIVTPYSVSVSNTLQTIVPAAIGRPTIVNVWTTNGVYSAGDLVFFATNVYKCVYPFTNSVAAPTNTGGIFTNDTMNGWLYVKSSANGYYGDMVNAWVTNTTHAAGTYVGYRSGYYWCIASTTNSPADTTKWMVIPVSRTRMFISNNNTGTVWITSTNGIRIEGNSTYEVDSEFLQNELTVYGNVNTNRLGIQEVR